MRPQSDLKEGRIVRSDYRDFLAKVDSGIVDLVLTDPPYSISKETGFAKVKNGVERFAVSMDFGEWDHQEIDLVALAKESFRVLRRGGTVIIWYDLWKISSLKDALEEVGFKMLRLITWQKTNPVPLNSKATYLSNSREVAVCAVKGGKPTFNSEYDDGIYRYPIPREGNGNGRYHPTQKPVGLFSELVEKHSNPQDLVVDPFAGCGTTAVACLDQDRQFSGCDINLDYVEVANQRIDAKLPDLEASQSMSFPLECSI